MFSSVYWLFLTKMEEVNLKHILINLSRLAPRFASIDQRMLLKIKLKFVWRTNESIYEILYVAGNRYYVS